MIIVKNKELLFTNREQYIGTPGDNISSTRMFAVPRVIADGIDITHLSFRLNIQYPEKITEADTAYLEKEVGETTILLAWTISKNILQKPGTLFINIRGFDDTGVVRWTSYMAAVYVEPTIGNPDLPGEGLTELEELERTLDRKLEEAKAAETRRQQAEEGRVIAEREREKRTGEVLATLNETVETTENYAAISKSYAVGNSGIRPGENVNNARYYSGQSELAKGQAISAQQAAEQAMKDVIFRLDNGEFKGETGPPGPRGPQGDSGVFVQGGLFGFQMDNADDCALYVLFEETAGDPNVIYDETDGKLYWEYDDGKEAS